MALEHVKFRTPNRVAVRTGHKLFDSQCDLVMTGNVMSNTQLSAFIRPVSDTECNGFTFAPGHLFNTDIKPFRADLPPLLESWIRGLGQQVILYEFRHWTRGDGVHRKHVHGYVVTDSSHKLLKALVVGSQRHRSHRVLTALLPYIADLSATTVAA